MTMYREDFTVGFVSKFVLLTFIRVFHWLCSDRVDLIFQTVHGPPSFLQLSRIGSALGLFMVVDIFLTYITTKSVLASGPSNEVVFAFEYALLLNSIILSMGTLLLNTKESDYLEANEDEDRWEPKATYLFYLHITMDVTRLVVICAFFVALLKPYGVPLHLLRDLYITATGLTRRIQQHRAFLKTRSLMDEGIPNAVAADLERDDMCIICREEMEVFDASVPLQHKTPKKLHCGHVIHHGCLKSWFERSQRCPTCRQPVLDDHAMLRAVPATTANANADAPAVAAPEATPNENPVQQAAEGQQYTQEAREVNFTDVVEETPENTNASTITNDFYSNSEPNFFSTRTVQQAYAEHLPAGWTVVPSRTAPSGEVQIEFSPGLWSTVRRRNNLDSTLSNQVPMPSEIRSEATYRELQQRLERMERLVESMREHQEQQQRNPRSRDLARTF